MADTVPPELSEAPFELTAHLGRGASADLWRAVDASGTTVTLKVGLDDDAATTLAQEALAASLASSPRLPALLGVARVTIRDDRASPTPDDRGRPAIALRYAPGHGLDRPSTTLSEREVIGVAHDVAEALADLHGAGLAHGDVKPANVILGPDGRARLIDLGLAGPSASRRPRGGTPRYLARGDRELGDARARDLLALGLLIAELADDEVRTSRDLIDTARQASLNEPLGRLVGALLSPAPGARPSAAWVASAASSAVTLEADARGPRRVRASYLRLRRDELAGAAGCADGVAPWLGEVQVTMQRLRALCASCDAAPPAMIGTSANHVLAPLSLAERRRWLVSLVGPAAIDWPLDGLEPLGEPELAQALTGLAAERSPRAWTIADVEAAARGERPTPALVDAEGPLDDETLVGWALAVGRRPVDVVAIRAIEQRAQDLPASLRLAAADVLRLAGDLGRARGLLWDLEEGGAVVADVLRRAGEIERAETVARHAIEGRDLDGRARAVLARLLLDRGDVKEAAALVSPHPRHAAVAEVAALIAHASGDEDHARALAERGLALARTAEARARCAGALAYVTAHRDPDTARRGFRLAVAQAVEAGAILEEASYRTGEAATCVDRGALREAIDTAERAALLWDEVLDQPPMAARAWLARAAAYAALDLAHEASLAAGMATRRAMLGDDPRAEAHACWALADALPMGAPEASAAARRADALSEDGYDADHSAARLWRHVPQAVGAPRRESLDRRCRHATATSDVYVRLSWWAARAERLVDEPQSDDAASVLSELTALADTPAPIVTRGKAMHAGCRLAIARGDTDSLARLEEARRRDASRVMGALDEELVEAARQCDWLSRAAEGPGPGPSRRERAIDLQQLVRALSERDTLQTLLDRVVDVLLLWTGAERGLLLMPGEDGELEPRSARNLGRHDLEGEQLAVSSSLARRAMDSGEPVVAVDAMAELSSSYDSVHALKLRSVLALPLAARGEQLGCVYLDDRVRRGAFGDDQVAWARSVAPVAALAISDAARQAALEEAVQRAEEASRRLEDALAEKESALDVAHQQLARSRSEAEPLPDRGIVGDSEAMRRVLLLVDRVATSDVPVLLRGESGSGKELVARAIHAASGRAEAPFVGENCGALPETLLESALFGHVKGAFTGAHRPRVGLFEAADGGTLFLDEIGEMSLGMQTKLLRVLEDSMVRPVGSTQARKVDVRILAATHRDLEQMVADGSFREDLYYRLNVITVPIPALRERASDVPLLVRHLIDKHAPDRLVAVTPAAMDQLSRHPWPGNVRQLENEVRRALIMAEDVIDTDHLSTPASDAQARPPVEPLDLKARVDELEVRLVQQALERTEGNQTQAAKLLGISRYGLHKMMKRLGLKD